ncbi:MAG TPA: sulfur carrier protein ThiS [Acidobacteriota bacterium]|nr:sulfur carrier protein ThiS [Acidobacteriota bacterium]
MRARVNGAEREVSPGMSVGALVSEVTADAKAVAVAINRAVLPRKEWSEVRVKEGDDIEIIAPFHGG